MKTNYILIFIIIVLTHSTHQSSMLSDNDKLQRVLEGMFAYNNLQGPFMFKYCFDDETSSKIVNFAT